MNNSFIATMNSNIQRARAGLETSSTALCKGDLVDLNRLVQQVFEDQHLNVAKLQTIVRCDTLPMVQGRVQLLLALFRSFLGLILDNPPQKSKLFIYVKCECKETDIIDMTLPEGFADYRVSIYTNSYNG